MAVAAAAVEAVIRNAALECAEERDAEAISTIECVCCEARDVPMPSSAVEETECRDELPEPPSVVRDSARDSGYELALQELLEAREAAAEAAYDLDMALEEAKAEARAATAISAFWRGCSQRRVRAPQA